MTDKSDIDRSSAQQIAKQLAQTLSNTFVLYVKTLNFHWNVEDPRFHSLHKMFQEQYEELATAIDDMAERIRGLGFPSPGMMKEFLEMATLQEAASNLSGDEMIRELQRDNEALCREMRPAIEVFQKLGDEGSADFLIERLRVHEKVIWMLRSHFPS